MELYVYTTSRTFSAQGGGELLAAERLLRIKKGLRLAPSPRPRTTSSLSAPAPATLNHRPRPPPRPPRICTAELTVRACICRRSCPPRCVYRHVLLLPLLTMPRISTSSRREYDPSRTRSTATTTRPALRVRLLVSPGRPVHAHRDVAACRFAGDTCAPSRQPGRADATVSWVLQALAFTPSADKLHALRHRFCALPPVSAICTLSFALRHPPFAVSSTSPAPVPVALPVGRITPSRILGRYTHAPDPRRHASEFAPGTRQSDDGWHPPTAIDGTIGSVYAALRVLFPRCKSSGPTNAMCETGAQAQVLALGRSGIEDADRNGSSEDTTVESEARGSTTHPD
ncbi:hypothetical protein DFH07DRAFT_954626 [Mycena maculata]|uniref:Uncharacterized protein n=1 Tax=Mycena maculata TaxID=230809 RepID=A0AAD7JMF8_9AGAR|nr:hypothetical protein DFH07DRAFT_954626 [Mycena maculata]